MDCDNSEVRSNVLEPFGQWVAAAHIEAGRSSCALTLWLLAYSCLKNECDESGMVASDIYLVSLVPDI